jgi:hypothetical protein
MPTSAPRRADAALVERIGDLMKGDSACSLYLADDRQHIRRVEVGDRLEAIANLCGVIVTALVASHFLLDARFGFFVSGFHPVRPLGRALVGRRELAVV